MKTRDLQQLMPKALRDDYGRALRELKDADIVRDASEREISGQTAKFVELTDQHPNT
jgi:hypothetical protein